MILKSNVYEYVPATTMAKKRGHSLFSSHCMGGTKLLLALKVAFGNFSPELQYLPKKQNSGFLDVPLEHNEMSQEIGYVQIAAQITT